MATHQSIASRAPLRTPAPVLAESERHLLRVYRRLDDAKRKHLLAELRLLTLPPQP